MGLIYKPNVLYMTPKNESIDVTNEAEFSFVFKGYQMSKAIGQLYENSNIGEWTALGDSFTFATMGANPFYNNETVSYSVTNPSTVYSSLTNNANSTLGWGVTVYGMLSAQAASGDNKMVPSLKGYETGNMVSTFVGADDTTPYNYTFISEYDSKLTLGTINVDDSTFNITESEYINLTTGDKIKETVNSTAYYINKVDEGTPDLTVFKIKVYNTKANAIAGGSTGLQTSGLNHKTFYVNPENSTSSVFYVGVVGNAIKLYTSKEAALQGVAEAVVPLVQNTVYAIQIFENSQIVQFTPIIKNSIVFDEDDIYPENRTFTLTEYAAGSNIYVYSNNQVDLYSGQHVRIDYGSYEKVYHIEILNEADSQLYLYVGDSTTPAFLDNGANTATAELIECLSDSVTFIVKWNDPENIPLIYKWEAMLYGYDSSNSMLLIEKSNVQYNADVRYKFSHLLLSSLSKVSGTTGIYKVAFNVWDNNDYKYYGEIIFDVGYPVLEINYSPEVSVDNCDSSVSVDWNNALSVEGETTATHLTYVSNFYAEGNKGVTIPASKTITFETPIPAGCFPTFLWRPDSGFSGIIMSLDGDSQEASLSYDSVLHNFILSVTDKDSQNTTSINVDTDVSTLNSSHIYLIGYTDDGVYIRDLSV